MGNQSRRITNRRRRSGISTRGYSVLENRRLLAVSVTLEGSVLTIVGDGVANDVLVEDNPVDNTYDVTLDFEVTETPVASFPQASVDSIEFTGRSGDDIMRNSTSLPMLAYGNAGDDTFFGGQGIDRIFAGNGADILFGSDGEDILNGNDGHDAIYGGDGNDLINGGPTNDSIFGGAGDDVIYGERGDDVIFAGDGNDTVFAFTGEDTIYGDGGDDLLYGQAGDDTIFGGDGADRLRGNPGADDLDGEEGNDFVKGDQDDDIMEGGDGNDTMHGWTGNDRMTGGAGNDLMYGQDGDDYMNGNDGNDVVRGGNDNDRLYGDAGSDIVRGDAGLDGMAGGIGAGVDRLFGNDGADRFLTESTDLIMDEVGEDAVLIYENSDSDWTDAEIELMDTALEVMHHRTLSTLLLTDSMTSDNLTFTKVAEIAGTAFGSNTLSDNGGVFTRSIQFEEFDEEGLFDKSDFMTSVYVQIARNWNTSQQFQQLGLMGSPTSFEDFMALSTWTPESNGDPGIFFELSNDGQWYYDSSSEFTFSNDDSDPEDNPCEDFATTWEYYFDRYSSGSSPIGMQDKYDFFDALMTFGDS
ncbi:calcium-binding protein [Mariniblastus fucicola]|uniref:Bifunctional hemolysin/adenylate cyclase n=1 Tax=Mariniblastus fucicola TaxID=980251 RepID=A0A5B9PBP2_9BACT|nr:calcium-binding protein [Mariniblastus fucicola]QEG24127.1 Bifunctional hemolysin/adenylate cyclase precursor [Mariniblastus fucicola]